MNKLHLDFETRSPADIKIVGAFAYARHPGTRIMCLAYAFDDQKPQILTPEMIRKIGPFALGPGDRVVAHSAQFEYAIWNYVLAPQFGWPTMWEPQRWECTLSRSVACGLPADLSNAALAVGLPVKKDLKGRQAMLKLSKPMDFDPLTGDPIYREDPELYAQLYPYCLVDVEVEQGLDKRLPALPEIERRVWELDLVMNHRGLRVDVPLCKKATLLAGGLIRDLNRRLQDLTNGGCDSATRVAAMKRYLEEKEGLVLASLNKASIDTLLASPDVSEHAKAVLSIRRQVGKKTSIAKFARMAAAADPVDQRVRGVIQYHAAHTGRDGGRLIQPQNFTKGWNTEEEQTLAVEAIMQ